MIVDAVAEVILAIAATVIAIPVVVLTRISWHWLMARHHEQQAMRLLGKTLVEQQRKVADGATKEAAIAKIKHAAELRQRELEDAILSRRQKEEAGQEVQTMTRTIAERDQALARIEQLTGEINHLKGQLDLEKQSVRDLMLQVNAKTEEIYNMEKIIDRARLSGSEGRGDLLTRTDKL